MGIFDKLFPKDGETEELKSAQDQSRDELDLISHIKSKVEECRSSGSRITHEGIWMTNIAYILGFDSVFYDTSIRQFKVVGRGSNYLRRNRIHVNKILPTVQNRLARLCKNPPRYDVRPLSSNIEDKDACTLGKQIIDTVWDIQKINRKRIELMMWVQQCGHAYMKVSWDDTLGKPLPDLAVSPLPAALGDQLSGTLPDLDSLMGTQAAVGENGVVDLDAALTTPTKVEYEGDIRVDVCSPFEMFPDPLAKTLDECTWIVQAKVRKLDYFRTQYPERGSLVKEESAWLLSAQYEARINNLNNQGPSTTGVQNQLKNAAIELSYYERRSQDHPNGRRIICANGILLKDDELPAGEIPFAKFDDIIIGGKFYSESIITHLRPIQDQYNRTISKRAEWVNRLLAGKYIAAKGHGLQQEVLNDQSGEVVEYSPVPNAAPPTAMPIPNIPAYAYTEEERLQGMMYDISGINEVSRGQLPSASIPAVGMQLLVEQDDTRIGITTEAHEESYAYIGKLILLYAEEYYKTPRLLKISGRAGQYTVKEFTGADIKGNHDVIVIRGSTLPGSKVLKRQEILNLHQGGYFGNPQDPNVVSRVMTLLEYGDVAEAWADVHLDQGQFKKSMDMIKSGQIPPASEFDNHAYIIQDLNRFRKTDDYTALGEQNKMIFDAFMEQHIQYIMQKMDPSLAPGNAPLSSIQPPAPPTAHKIMQAKKGGKGIIPPMNHTPQVAPGNGPSPSPASPAPQGGG